MAVGDAPKLPVLGTLPATWKVAELGALLENGTRNGIYKPAEFHGSGTKMVNMGELFAHPRLKSVPMRRVELTKDEAERFGLRLGDLLFARRSLVAEGAGKCSVVIEMGEPTAFESSLIRARPDPRAADSLYLYYLFASSFGVYILQSILRQVAVSGITGSDLVRLQIPVPPLAEQRAIAHILGTLDDKIELNRRMNETLEAMARAIFKSWFVHFDAVRAKAEGRQPSGMNAATAALFPDSFQASPLGEIPKGWKAGAIGDFVTAVGGSTPSTKEPRFWDGSICFATPKDMSSLQFPILLETERKITEAGLAQISSGFLPKGTVLLSSRAPIGYLALTEIPVAVNQGIIAMICDKELPTVYVLHWVKENIETIVANANGTTFLEISKANFRPILALAPPSPVLERFTKVVEPLHASMVSNERESKTLAAVRDALLPKLISGEIRIKGATRPAGVT